MRRFGSMVLFLFSSLCGAQVNKAPYVGTVLQALPEGSCPIEVIAKPQLGTSYLMTDSVSAVHPVYTIELHPKEGKPVREVSIRLVGPTGLHIERIANSSVKGDSAERFTLAKMLNPDVVPTKLTAVRWIDVVSVTYTDGSTWHQGKQEFCRVVPSYSLPPL
jgi:hypothetical protein